MNSGMLMVGEPHGGVPPTALRTALDVVVQLADRTQTDLQRVTDENASLQKKVLQLTAANQDIMQTIQQLSAPHAMMMEADVNRRVMATELSRLDAAAESHDFTSLLLHSTMADTTGAFLEMLACELFELQVMCRVRNKST